MTHLALPWWPRTTSATSSSGDAHGRGGRNTAATATSSAAGSSSSNCCGLSRLMRKLKKHSKMLQPASRQSSSLQCRYDPLSYSLNFDTTGSGDFADDDYYKFYAFSSRFVAAPRNECQRLVAVAHWWQIFSS